MGRQYSKQSVSPSSRTPSTHRALWGGALGVVAITASACSLFEVREPRVLPTPAAATDSDREEAPEVPVALAEHDDFVVRVVAGSVDCSGTLIDEKIVLTAHHCVSQRSRHGDILASDVSPEDVRVELGGDYLPWGEVDVAAIVTPDCGHAAGPGDIALLVLDRKLIGVSTARPRLDAGPREGETVEPVGFGRCALTRDGIRRRPRSGGSVETVMTRRFSAEASICPGDSGGPALGADGKVVGIISASVMDGSASTRGQSEFTRLDAFRPLFASATAIASGQSAAELPPLDLCD